MRLLIVIILLGSLVLFGLSDIGLYVDYLWFHSEQVDNVFLTTLSYEVRTFALFGAVAALFLGINLAIVQRVARQPRVVDENLFELPRLAPVALSALVVVAAVFVGILFGASSSGEWRLWALASHATSFGANDPVLNRPVSWYIFELPFLQFLAGYANTLLVLTALGVFGLSMVVTPDFVRVSRTLEARGEVGVEFSPPTPFILHIAVLTALFFLLKAAEYRWLSPAELLLAQHKTGFGANFIDVQVRMPVFALMAGVMGLCAALSVYAGVRRSLVLLLIGPAVWIVVGVIGQGIVPVVGQALFVAASELQRESPYIGYNIQATRTAFNLDVITTSHPTVQPLTQADVQADPQTIANIRLWDWRPLQETYQQLQGLRPYYRFPDVDVDRYLGQQVMLAARELDLTLLPVAARNWQNEHLVYTHGFGVVASTANGVGSQGTPDLILRDIPPTSSNPALEVTQPGLYYTHGVSPSDWVLVKTKATEFDYPSGSTNASTTYSGAGGIPIDSFTNRLLFATYLGDPLLLYTSYIEPGSKILIHRSISDMVRKITPFLTLDADPYLVIVDGKLYWIVDAYTRSSHYPYSQPAASGDNYIRNSVKIVISAYDGTITYYRTDTPDHPEPILQAYSDIFPGLFKPFSSMPAALQAHIRYPEDLFTTQATMLNLYHVTDPSVFYNREDVWTTPTEAVGTSRVVMQPYYVEIRLPGETQAEFTLIQPFVPNGRDNMIAWLAARSDPPHYGQLLLYEFSKDSLIYGPQQIEARIDQDPAVSSSLTLWNQQGSSVIRGNLLIIPLGNAFLYVEPLFLQASQGQIPELKRVILATSTTLTMQSTFPAALDALFSGAPSVGATANANVAPTTSVPATATPAGTILPTPTVAPPGTPGAPLTDAERTALAQDALKHYQQAKDDLAKGDWAGYGSELSLMQQDLERLAAQ